jgi:hypothetical protein
MPVKIIFGGPAPQQQVVQMTAPQRTKKSKGGGNSDNTGNSGGASAPASAPAPVVNTGSSK